MGLMILVSVYESISVLLSMERCTSVYPYRESDEVVGAATVKRVEPLQECVALRIVQQQPPGASSLDFLHEHASDSCLAPGLQVHQCAPRVLLDESCERGEMDVSAVARSALEIRQSEGVAGGEQ